MKLASWNVNSIKIRANAVRDWLAEHAPDAILLQELKCETAAFPAEIFHAAGYEHTLAVGQKAYNGVAVIARRPFEVILDKLPILTRHPGAGRDPDQNMQGWAPAFAGVTEEDVQARYLEIKINNLHIINIYAPNGNPIGTEKFAYKLAWLKRLQTRLEALIKENKPFVIMGDYNIIPETADCFDPAAWMGDALFQPESRAAFRSMINLGLTDAIRMFYPHETLYTFWDYQGGAWNNNLGIRIDHILMSPAVADRCMAAGVDKAPRGREQPSDHVPVWVELR